MKVLHRVFAFLFLPVLGYLLGATIFLHFYDQAGTGDLDKADFIAVATSCDGDGPVTVLGFGYRWSCLADVTRTESGRVSTTVTTGFLKPEDIGRQVAVVLERRSAGFAPEERPYQALGVLLNVPFLALWVYVIARAGNPLMKERRDRALAAAENPEPEAPVTEVHVMGGRKGWLPGRVAFVFLVLFASIVVRTAGAAFDASPRDLTSFVVGLAGLSGLIGYGMRRWSTMPSVTINATGLTLQEELPWERIDRVRLVGGRLVVHQRGGPPLTSGRPFGDHEVEKIDQAMLRFSPVSYATVPGPL